MTDISHLSALDITLIGLMDGLQHVLDTVLCMRCFEHPNSTNKTQRHPPNSFHCRLTSVPARDSKPSSNAFSSSISLSKPFSSGAMFSRFWLCLTRFLIIMLRNAGCGFNRGIGTLCRLGCSKVDDTIEPNLRYGLAFLFVGGAVGVGACPRSRVAFEGLLDLVAGPALKPACCCR